MDSFKYDVFISHASEDKDDFVRPLANALVKAGVNIWYDEFTLRLGDSLRASIDKGLSESKYGIVVLSPYFFEKKFPQEELNGLFSKQVITGTKTLIPIWHKIDKEYLLEKSPLLTDKVAAKTSEGVDSVIQKILNVVKPETSHFTDGGLTISIMPKEIRLRAGGWAVRTPVTITNHTEQPLYNTYMKITVPSNDLPIDSIEIQKDDRGSALKGNAGSISMKPDVIRFDCENLNNNEMVLILLSKIDANSSRELFIKGNLPKERKAVIEIISFDTKPSELLIQDNKLAFPFKVQETIKIKSIFLNLKRLHARPV